MTFQAFREQFYSEACFSIHQVFAWNAGFNRKNLINWTNKGLLIKLRNGYYAFAEYLEQPNFALYIANRIYRPSYISLHKALAFYGIIPEAIVQVTSVTSLKTAAFSNSFGEYTYKHVQPQMMFGYDSKPFLNNRSILIAQPEKAILDLLYLYPFYNSIREIEELRLDEDFLREELKTDVLKDYCLRFKSKALTKRAMLLLKTYGL